VPSLLLSISSSDSPSAGRSFGCTRSRTFGTFWCTWARVGWSTRVWCFVSRHAFWSTWTRIDWSTRVRCSVTTRSTWIKIVASRQNTHW
jgi:hypothetical protein